MGPCPEGYRRFIASNKSVRLKTKSMRTSPSEVCVKIDKKAGAAVDTEKLELF